MKVEQDLTLVQAFEAMPLFPTRFNGREPEGRRETILHLLDWTQVESNGGTAGPAQWFGWEDAVAKVRAETVEP